MIERFTALTAAFVLGGFAIYAAAKFRDVVEHP